MTDSLVGTLFVDKYEILQVLGQGGMGTVYKARNRINGSLRAIKLLNSHVELNAEALRRFDAEASAISRFKHENVIEIIDVGFVNQEQPYLVMEYIDGVSLSDLLKQQGALPVAQAIPLFTQICAALSSAHAHGVLHRDIKPSNIMLVDTPANRLLVKVVDFGIAKIIPNENDGTMIETATGIIIGSPPYMSPEQCLGEKLDLRSDIYSLGCLMYETLSGEPPLVGNSPAATMYKHLNEAPAPLVIGSVDLRLVNRLNQIFSKALNKLPERRYQSMDELRLDLETAMQQSRQSFVVFSILQIVWSRLRQNFQNSLGSSKIIFVLVLVITLTAASAASLVLLPTAFVKAPTAEQLFISWKPRPKFKYVSFSLQKKYEVIVERLKKMIAESETAEQTNYNPELMSLHKQLGDAYFDLGAYNQAALTYNQALKQGLKGLSSAYSNFQQTPVFVHDIGLIYLRSSQCALESGDLNGAVAAGKAGLAWSFSDHSGDPSYKGFLPEVIAVATIKLTHSCPPLMREYIDNFLRFSRHVKADELGSYVSARALSQIADCFVELGQSENALSVLKRVREAWQEKDVDVQSDKAIDYPSYADQPKSQLLVTFGGKTVAEKENMIRQKCGPFNAAVAEYKIAEAEQRLGKLDDAIRDYQHAANEFEGISGAKDLYRAKALFRKANALWLRRDFYNALVVRAEALKNWKTIDKLEREN
jgi:serine/threonine protein kinase